MKISDGYRLARNNLKRTKMRSWLTIGGVIVSISSIVLLVSLGVGLQKISVNRIASINALTRVTAMVKEGSNIKLNDAMINNIKKVNKVEFVSPEYQFPARATFLETQSDIMAVGIKKEYLNFSDITVTSGRQFAKDNDEVLVSKAVLKLYGKENDPDGVIGKEIELNVIMPGSGAEKLTTKKIQAKIVGTTSDETISSIYMPITLLEAPNVNYNSLSVKVADRKSVSQVKDELERMGLQTTSVSDLVNQIDQAFLYFQIILAAIGGIALFVAAIGIINTMTISLLERTHEIGIMKSLGARNKDIRMIFLYESGMIGLMGGVTGILIGWLVGLGINLIIELILKSNNVQETMVLFVMPINFALGILTFSILLSLLAGVYPARRAARLSPLEALRQ